MASNYQNSEVGTDPLDYSYLLGFWRETWFKAFAILEIILFGGGYLFAQLGAEMDQGVLAGQAPDVHLALGGVMGALGILFAVAFAVSILLSIWLRLQKLLEPDVEF